MNEEFRIICDGGSLRIYKGDYGFNFEEIVDLLNEQQATIKKLQDLCGQSDGENAKLRLQNKIMKEEERLYAQEILRLNELLKQYNFLNVLG